MDDVVDARDEEDDEADVRDEECGGAVAEPRRELSLGTVGVVMGRKGLGA